MDFIEGCEAAWGESWDIVQIFYDVGFPERARHIQRSGVEAGGEDAELFPIAGFGERDVSHMEFYVKVLVFHPIGVV